MSDIGAMIAAALLKEVVQQIGSLVGGQIKLQQNFDKDLNQMKTTLESIEPLLKDAEHANTNNSMRLWINRLKDAMYGIADMIDDFEAEQTPKFSIKKLCKMGLNFTLANKMKMMREELQGITDQYQKFMLVPCTNADELKVIQMRETSPTIEASIIGRAEEENKIWVSLSERVIEELIVLAIHGIGGLGKTTLAKMIYNNKTKFEDYVRVWIYVSETFDLNKIGNSLISQLSENESTYTEKLMIHKSLAKLFTNKKILIILDDLWAEDDSQLDSLIAMLMVGKGSKVVVIATTRNEEIARKISTIPPHELASLTDEMCWTIIKEKSGFESRDDKEQLKHTGEAIAAKCGGVALAAQSIGPILETMTYNQWKKVRDSDIWKESASSYPNDKTATRVLESLRLSYTFMPRYLKLCFAYWAIFPKGCKISKGDLIHQWISLSFIVATPTFTTWELGEMYITQLLKISFIEHSKIVRYGTADVTAFTMQNLVHDLARSVMDDEILLADNDGNIGRNRCQYALLSDCSNLLESRRIRALRFMGSAKIRLDDVAFACAKSLRVLDLSECPIHELTNSIGRFKQLRYLNAPRVHNKVILDSITRLSKLLYLSLRESSLSALPESIGKMEGLMYLDLSRCERIKELPESFGKLKKLMHLDLSECSGLENISKFMWSFTDLRYLNLSICYRIGWLPKSLAGLTSLQYLNLSQCLREGENHSLMDHISALSNLEHLDLSWNDGITSLPESFCNLRNLHTLDLSFCQKIQKIPESMSRIDNLKTSEKPVPHPSTNFNDHFTNNVEPAPPKVDTGGVLSLLNSTDGAALLSEETAKLKIGPLLSCGYCYINQAGNLDCRDTTAGERLNSAEAMEPRSLKMELLRKITNKFAEERVLGKGAYGEVYRGVCDDGQVVAVKLLYNLKQTIDDEQFIREFKNLMMLKHPNIVRLVGYCYETLRQHEDFKGTIVFGERTHKALCFEYMPKGSLRKHLSDECNGLDWQKRYKIIKGACEGLRYLHEGLGNPLYHLDLKPDNILLDENMAPKLADFGLSKFYGEEQTRMTESPIGTIGYTPPEYLFGRKVSKKFDIFSLGVVMTKIIAGPSDHNTHDEKQKEFLDQVQGNWRKRLQTPWCFPEQLEAQCQQVKRCTEIALSCMDMDWHRRPSIVNILDELTVTEKCIEKATNYVQDPSPPIASTSTVF